MQGIFSYKRVLMEIYDNTNQNSQAPFSLVIFHQIWVSLASQTFSSYISCLNDMNFPSALAFRDYFSCNILIRESVREVRSTDQAKKCTAHRDLFNETLQCLENPSVSLRHSFKILRKEFSSICTDLFYVFIFLQKKSPQLICEGERLKASSVGSLSSDF